MKFCAFWNDLRIIFHFTNWIMYFSFNQHRVAAYTILQLDKATQTDESCIFGIDTNMDTLNDPSSNKSEKVLRQRLQRVQQRTGEHSVSSQTLSPIQSKLFINAVDNQIKSKPRKNQQFFYFLYSFIIHGSSLYSLNYSFSNLFYFSSVSIIWFNYILISLWKLFKH